MPASNAYEGAFAGGDEGAYAGRGSAQEGWQAGVDRYWPVLLSLVTLLSRLIYTSAPFYVDGPAHVQAIRSGTLFIQPPGYLLYAELGRVVASGLHLSPGGALHWINVLSSTVGVFLFATLALRLFSPKLAVMLSSCYAFSDVIWFVADIHSSYALSAALVMGLLYLSWREDAGWWMGAVWALETGVRPSEGVFMLPFVALTLWRQGRVPLLRFACVALPLLALWYLPTVQHFGGGMLSPLRSSEEQLGPLTNGLFTHETLPKKAANLLHLSCSIFNAWNVMTLALVGGLLLTKQSWVRSLGWVLLPGFAFYAVIFFSDPAYLAYLVAPGFLLAGEGLRRLSEWRQWTIATATLVISVSQMMLFRPIVPHSTATAVLNSYVLEYSGWAIRHQYFMRLEKAMKAVGEQHPESAPK